MVSYKKLIHDKLVEVARAGTFRKVNRSGDTMSVVETVSVAPKSVMAFESGSTFAAALNRRYLCLDRETWDWGLYLNFNTEITSEFFEEWWMTNIPVIPATSDHRQITLYIVDVSYEHPERNQPARGTSLAYTIRVEIGPR